MVYFNSNFSIQYQLQIELKKHPFIERSNLVHHYRGYQWDSHLSIGLFVCKVDTYRVQNKSQIFVYITYFVIFQYVLKMRHYHIATKLHVGRYMRTLFI